MASMNRKRIGTQKPQFSANAIIMPRFSAEEILVSFPGRVDSKNNTADAN